MNAYHHVALRRAWDRHAAWIIVASSLSFALAHLPSPLLQDPLGLSGLMLLIFSLNAMILAFARVRLGLMWAMLLHAGSNAVLVILSALMR